MIQWNPRGGVILIDQYGWLGSRLHGTETIRADGTRVVDLDGTMPDGSRLTFRDETTILGPDQFRSVSFKEEGSRLGKEPGNGLESRTSSEKAVTTW